jgi:hypothetical protein
MEPGIKVQLLASMASGRLVIVCGAGLSMAAPSSLPSAWRVAQKCFDEYQLTIDPTCDPVLRDNLEAFAEHFVPTNNLKTVFIERLVPWTDFVRPPNAGHAAIADFLVTRSAFASLSGNYDTLIEQHAVSYGFDFRGSLDGDEAVVSNRTQGPLLKFHGCSTRDRPSTVWALSQLNDPTISARIEKSKTWIEANLRQKDLLIIGFWSDWAYLNQIVGSALTNVGPLSVTVVDPSSAEQLQEKAPDLWALAHAENVAFHHVQESGAEVLDELRRAFSTNYLRQVIAAGKTTFEQSTGEPCDPDWLDMPEFDSETLYGLCRDAEGVPWGKPATKTSPGNCEALGFFHLLLRQSGAEQQPDGYVLGGRHVRVINGAGMVLGTLRSRFIEAPSVQTADIVVAVGATDLGLPDNVVRRGRENDVVRPEVGGIWFDLARAREELNI